MIQYYNLTKIKKSYLVKTIALFISISEITGCGSGNNNYNGPTPSPPRPENPSILFTPQSINTSSGMIENVSLTLKPIECVAPCKAILNSSESNVILFVPNNTCFLTNNSCSFQIQGVNSGTTLITATIGGINYHESLPISVK
ncbi:MAG TPA: hypothetical protein PKD00_08145 [Burkholderiales bacterium]|nr:hypothetical protein [Burkholderiales bacterium]